MFHIIGVCLGVTYLHLSFVYVSSHKKEYVVLSFHALMVFQHGMDESSLDQISFTPVSYVSSVLRAESLQLV